ncbi:hypothetical protein IWX49DRAFT_125605 [Phyllosticta citricarpa]
MITVVADGCRRKEHAFPHMPLQPLTRNLRPAVGHAFDQKRLPVHLRGVESQQLPPLDQPTRGKSQLVAVEDQDFGDDVLVAMLELPLLRPAEPAWRNGVATSCSPDAQGLGIVGAFSLLNAVADGECEGLCLVNLLGNGGIAGDWCRRLIAWSSSGCWLAIDVDGSRGEVEVNTFTPVLALVRDLVNRLWTCGLGAKGDPWAQEDGPGWFASPRR